MKIIKHIRESIVLKTIVVIVSVLVGYSCMSAILGYREVTNALLSQYSDGAFRIAEISTNVIDPDRIEAYEESGGVSDEYLDVEARLSGICNSSGSTFVYVIVPDRSDYKHIKFLFSTMNQKSDYTKYPFGYVRETTNEDYAEKYKKICEEQSPGELVIRNQGYIETDAHITAMIPLTGSNGEVQAILCVQRQMDDLKKFRNSFLLKTLLATLITAVLIIISLILRLNIALLRPIRILSAEASRFAVENVKADESLLSRIQRKDEIGKLAESIDRMETQIHDYVINLTKITAERERISTELSLAARIQRDMLPNVFPAFPDRTDFDIYGSMDPAKVIGGDFYNYFLVDEDHLCVFIADVSGKSVPAALFMMAATIVLVDNARMGKPPAEVLESANDAICATNREEMFVTVWLGILDLTTGRLTAANAGHEYPVIKNPDGNYELIKDKHGFVIGGMEGMTYRSYEVQMEPGSKLFLYTDGVPEASNRKEELFGTDRMLDALNREPDADPVTLLGNVKKAVDRFVGDAEQFDDLTMLCLEYKGKSCCGSSEVE